MKPKILFLSGSIREASYNKMLALEAANAANLLGAAAQFIDLKDYPVEIYNGDFEAKNGIPINIVKLKKLIEDSEGIFIASPEYNGSISALLKNILDWISRPVDGKEPNHAYMGKVIAIACATPSDSGGKKGLESLKLALSSMKANLSSSDFVVNQAYKKFDKTGKLIDASDKSKLQLTINELLSSIKEHRTNKTI